MKYKLIEEYFETQVFQDITQLYFDTVLQDVLTRHPITEAKGLFVRNNKVKSEIITSFVKLFIFKYELTLVSSSSGNFIFNVLAIYCYKDI